ncbi:hypothetical protein IT413_04070 [Candidatus Peregrinibacteria bacterium]|nr:hypothetical protein [Candidatus Peregrinibacteria bacterium]
MAKEQKNIDQLDQEYQRAQAETGLSEEELAETLAVRGNISRQVRSLLGDETDTKILKQKNAKEELDEKLNAEINDLLEAVGKRQPRYVSLDALDDFQNQLHLLAYEKLIQVFPDSSEAKKKFLQASRKITGLPIENQMILFGTLQRAIDMSNGNIDVFIALIDTFNEKGPDRVRNLIELKIILNGSPENIKIANEKLDELEKESGKEATFNLIFNQNRVVHDMASFNRRADYLILTFGRMENNFAYAYFEDLYKKKGREKAMSVIQKIVAQYKPTLKEADVIAMVKAA